MSAFSTTIGQTASVTGGDLVTHLTRLTQIFESMNTRTNHLRQLSAQLADDAAVRL